MREEHRFFSLVLFHPEKIKKSPQGKKNLICLYFVRFFSAANCSPNSMVHVDPITCTLSIKDTNK